MVFRCAGLLLAMLLCSCATGPKSKFDSMGERSRRWVDTADAYAIDVLPGVGLSRVTRGDTAVLAGGAMFGLVGALIAVDIAKSNESSRGALLTNQDGLTDPAPLVARGLRSRMGSRHRMISDNANLRFKIRTSGWGLSGSTVGYAATLQVVSAATGTIVMKGECRYLQDVRGTGTSMDGLLTNSGAALKQQYQQAADYCSDYFAGQLFPTAS